MNPRTQPEAIPWKKTQHKTLTRVSLPIRSRLCLSDDWIPVQESQSFQGLQMRDTGIGGREKQGCVMMFLSATPRNPSEG